MLFFLFFDMFFLLKSCVLFKTLSTKKLADMLYFTSASSNSTSYYKIYILLTKLYRPKYIMWKRISFYLTTLMIFMSLISPRSYTCFTTCTIVIELYNIKQTRQFSAQEIYKVYKFGLLFCMISFFFLIFSI